MSRFVALPTITDDSALGGSTIERSLRFNGSDTYIQRTSSGGNRRTWTVSFWAKFCDSSATTDQRLWSCDGNSGNYDMLKIEFYGGTDSARRIAIIDQGHAGNGIRFTLNRKFRDSSAWYHFVFAQDSTQSTASERMKIYVNGVRETEFLDNSTHNHPPVQDYQGNVNATGKTNTWGRSFAFGSGTGNYLDGYLANINFIDGAQLEPSYFGYTEFQTKAWRPKKFDKSDIPNSPTTTYSNTFTASGDGFGSLPPSNAFNGNLTNGFNNNSGGQIITWNTTSYNLSGNVRIYGRGSAYDVYINGNATKVADMPSSNGWVDLGTHGNINEIQWAGTTYNTNNGLGSAGVHVNAIIVDGVWLRDNFSEFGTDGYQLNFSDISSTTAATMGKDSSGNGNNLTPNGFGATNVDALIDTPTNNFCILNDNDFNGGTLAEGNLRQNNGGSTNTTATLGMESGKWYWEIYLHSQNSGGVLGIGVGQSRRGNGLGNLQQHYGYSPNGQYYTTSGGSASGSSYGATLSAGDTVGVKFDADTRTLEFLKNNTSQGTKTVPAPGHGQIYLPQNHANNTSYTMNFGQDSTFNGTLSAGGNKDASGIGDFKYAVPSGYRALCTNNIINHNSKLILNPKKHFECLTYTGDDFNYREILGLNFPPDFLWIKNRSQADWHIIQNSIEGFQTMHYSNRQDGMQYDLNSNGYVNKPIRGENGQGGFSLNAQNSGNVNEDNENYVAWCWKGGSPTIETPSSGSTFFSEGGNYLDLGSYTDFQFGTGDYTIECWVYHTKLSEQQTYVGDAYGNSAGVYFYLTGTNKIAMYYSSQIAESSSTTMPIRKWVHIAASRSSGTLKLFQDGIEVVSSSDSANLTETQLNIGDTTGGSSGSMHGYMSNVRILKGTGLYTSNFTPPTSPLTNITNTVFLGCQSETVAGLASVHPSPFSNNGTNYSSGSQMSGDILPAGGLGFGGKDSLFDGKIGDYGSDTYVSSSASANTNMTWTPTSSISYSSKVEVWCYSPNGYGITVYYTLNGGSEQTLPVGGGTNFNNQAWCTLATGSGTITSINMRIIRPGSSTTINWGAIRIDGSILVNDVTGKVVTPTMDGTRQVPASPKNPFDGDFAVDGIRYQTAAAAGITDGSLPLNEASVNKEGGFSCVTYTGTGSAGTVAHGLGKIPTFWLMKSISGSSDWFAYSKAYDGSLDYFTLNTNNTISNSGATDPTSDFIGATTSLSVSGEKWIAYVWTDIPGYSKSGRYTGTGNGDGPFIYLGFKPAFVIFKATNSAESWQIKDNMRTGNNFANYTLFPNATNADYTTAGVDLLANGFKWRSGGGGSNGGGEEFIYFAVAETSGNTPFQNETTAR